MTAPTNKKDVKVTVDELARMTQRSFDYMQEHMATKDDVAEIVERIDSIEELMATKDDIAEIVERMDAMEQRMTTKEDLKGMASKEDLSRMEDKIDAKLDKLIDRFDTVIENHEQRITVLERA